MESVYDTEILEEIEKIYSTEKLPADTEDDSGALLFQESTETVVNVTTGSDNNQLTDILSCLIVIITILGVLCGIELGKLLWGRIK